jgi:iron complex transport system permease protein
MKAKSQLSVFLLMLLFTVIVIFGILVSLGLGSFHMQYDKILEIITSPNQISVEADVIWQIRLPRTLMAFLVGGALSLAGYQMQVVFQNPLADPYLLGVSSGASLGANAAIIGLLPLSVLGIYGISFWAALGALLVTLIGLALSAQANSASKSLKLILAGIALSSLCGAFNSMLIFFSAEENKLRAIIFWLLGSLDRSTWPSVGLISIALGISFIITMLLSPAIKLMIMGQQRAKSLGLNTTQLNYTLLIMSSLVSAIAVSGVGIIGFVGLVVPHLSRALFPIGSKAGIVATFAIGASLLLWCDILSRMLYAPTGLPIGVISAFLGLPFFLYLLQNKTYRF